MLNARAKKRIAPLFLIAVSALLIAGCGGGDSAEMKQCMRTAQSYNDLTDTQAREYCEVLGVR